ncbi:type VI secretion system baseplate subunit TssK [Marinomonas aquiplantarum]|uniref:Type VI secretion system protein ImpJ n=1 Tax=Marinomonas aquiplantarum TaxID=491951 RepID=A0A366CVP0_9GAMM|nr:type VI secretion system baseplate subunit TssK [Marinomonas aquiplantarum]RBO81900.1 type VI secretion system protein ImpJ [Marinomonas aquiplantarum]
MSRANRFPVCWHEGMLLSPQHFQQDNQYWEAQLQHLTLTSQPYRWGVVSMSLDESQLLEGVICLQSLHAIMPDGLQIAYDVRYDQPLLIDLNDVAQWDANECVKIQLTVPIRTPGAASQSADIQRFSVIESEPAKDDNTGEGELAMQRLMPILSLQASHDISAQYIAMPLFEVTKQDGAHFQITAFCPPMLGIGADAFLTSDDNQQGRQPLQKKLQQLAFNMRKKARQLAGYADDEERLGNRVSEQHRQWIRAMVQHLSEFELMADNGHSSPWQIYQILARLVGAMSELDQKLIPPKLPAYQHEDCHASLSEALSYLTQQLDKVNVRYTSLTFEESQEGVFSIMFDKAWGNQDLLIELKPKSTQTQSDLAQWLTDCRIASGKLHKELATKRLLGATTEATEYDEATGIQATANHGLFYLKNTPQFIKAGQSLIMTSTNGKLKHLQPKSIVLHLPHEPDQA